MKVQGIRCLECNTLLVSNSVHDFVGCGCPNGTFVDGGRDYTRYGGKSFDKMKLVWVEDGKEVSC